MIVFRISLDLDDAVFDLKSSSIKISQKEGNALGYDTDGFIKIESATIEPGNKRNTPGNSVAGNVDASIDCIRLNHTVTRKMDGDPTAGNEGCMVANFVQGFISYLKMNQIYVTTVMEYELLTTEPADWQDGYQNYYMKNDNGEYTKIPSKVEDGQIISIAFELDKYYQLIPKQWGYQLQLMEPSDWNVNYANYYYKNEDNSFSPVTGETPDEGEPTTPEWKKDTYYTLKRLSS